jgi:secreted protein with Ig-like and vWFA domain
MNESQLRELIREALATEPIERSQSLRSALEQKLSGEVVNDKNQTNRQVDRSHSSLERKTMAAASRSVAARFAIAASMTGIVGLGIYAQQSAKHDGSSQGIAVVDRSDSLSNWKEGHRLPSNVDPKSATSSKLAADMDTIVADDLLVDQPDLSTNDVAGYLALPPVTERKHHADVADGEVAVEGMDGTTYSLAGEAAAQTARLKDYFGNRTVGGVAVRPDGNAVISQDALGNALTQRQRTLAEVASASTGSTEFQSKLLLRLQLAQGETDRLLKSRARLKAMELEYGAQHPEVETLRQEVAGIEANIRRETETPSAEQYDAIHDNPFLPAKDAPLSTFSIDVDTASYANVRRFLMQGQLPPRNAVRIEELVNYFTYDYPQPTGDDPFSVSMEAAPCPWKAEHLLLRVGLKGKEIHRAERPATNLVFLIDTSGSMSDADKLPLVKQSLTMLTRELSERDRITIVTYAGEAGLKLAPTHGGDKNTIVSVIDSLNSNGSTHGSAGIQLAYEKARESFIKDGANRVILCTDGDLNVGITSDDELVELITREAKSGVFLTVLGFGTGNLKDSKMEKLADHGNGLYAYIDGLREAKKVLVEQMSGSLTTIAKDVKIQIEFNPQQVQAYRLIGYENRVLAAKDFNDDTKDAGEIGAGHTVTALYELIPAGAVSPKPAVDDLKYAPKPQAQAETPKPAEGDAQSKELLTLKLRYKQPDGDTSKKLEFPLAEKVDRFSQASADFRFAASVAGFGMTLRDSPYRGGITLAGVAEIAASSLGDDRQGYRAEFLDLVRRANTLKQ